MSKLSNDIQKWFADTGSFMLGVSLLGQTGEKTDVYQRYFSRDSIPNDIATQLYNALAKYLASHPASEEIATPVIREPKPILQLREKGRIQLKLRTNIHVEMRQAAIAGNATLAYDLAHQLMQKVQPEINRIYEMLSAYDTSGAVPDFDINVREIEDRVIKMMLRRESLKSRISRLKALVKKGEDVSKQKYLKEQAAKVAELHDIEIELRLKDE